MVCEQVVGGPGFVLGAEYENSLITHIQTIYITIISDCSEGKNKIIFMTALPFSFSEESKEGGGLSTRN